MNMGDRGGWRASLPDAPVGRAVVGGCARVVYRPMERVLVGTLTLLRSASALIGWTQRYRLPFWRPALLSIRWSAPLCKSRLSVRLTLCTETLLSSAS